MSTGRPMVSNSATAAQGVEVAESVQSAQPQFRPLRPAAPRPPPAPALQNSPITSSSSSIPKRTVALIACEACRKAKIRCDGSRPTCRICHRLRRECVYREPPKAFLKRKLAELDSSSAALDVFQAIQSRGEEEAANIYNRIRAGADPQTVLRLIREGDLLLQMHLVPETRLRYDFPYAAQMPKHLQTLPNPYLKSLIYEWTLTDNAAQAGAPRDNKGPVQYLKPYHAATFTDSRIDRIIPSKWTSVSSDNALMRDILRAYFQFEFSFFTFFHIDCFLNDMLAGAGQSCSRLLVNAVLATGCHTLSSIANRAENWSPRTLGYLFLAESRKLWDLDTSKRGRLAKVQAGMLLNLLTNVSGLDKVGNSTYLSQTTALVKEIGLYKPSTHMQDVSLRISREYTAWCFHWWQSFVNYSFRTPVSFDEPPEVPLPDPARHPGWYGEMWIKYPYSQHPVPLMHGELQRARLEFSTLVNLASRTLFNTANNLEDEKRDAQVIDLIARLKQWYARLPESMVPQNIAFPSQIRQHLHYHNIMIELYSSLSKGAGSQSTSQASRDPAFWATFAESKAHYETLFRLYYLRHSFEGADMILVHFLIIFAMQKIAKLETPLTAADRAASGASQEGGPPADQSTEDIEAARSAIVLAQKGLSDQGKNYYLPQSLFHVVLSQLPADDVNLVCRFANVAVEDNESRQLRALHTKSHYPLVTTNITAQERQNRLDAMMRKYADLSLESESDLSAAESPAPHS